MCMKPANAQQKCTFWRSPELFNIDFASYTLSNHEYPRHFHDHFVIELVIEGIDRFYCSGNTYTAQKNQLALINPGEVHTGCTVSDIPLRYFSFYPDNKTLERVAEVMDISLPPDFNFHRALQEQSGLTEKFRQLFKAFECNCDPLHRQEIFLVCMHELLSKPEKCYTTYAKDYRVQQLIEYIRVHFRENISLRQMSEQVRLNPFHMVRLFKKITGLSPYDYLLITRTEYAKQLLRKGSKVQEAALDAGFYDASHFNRIFCRTSVTSPKSFRQAAVV